MAATPGSNNVVLEIMRNVPWDEISKLPAKLEALEARNCELTGLNNDLKHEMEELRTKSEKEEDTRVQLEQRYTKLKDEHETVMADNNELVRQNLELQKKLESEETNRIKVERRFAKMMKDHELEMKESEDKWNNEKLKYQAECENAQEGERRAQKIIEELQVTLFSSQIQLISLHKPPKTLKYVRVYMKVFGEKAKYFGSSTCYLCWKQKSSPEAARKCANAHAGRYADENGELPYMTAEHERKAEEFLKARYEELFGGEDQEGGGVSPSPGPSRGGNGAFFKKKGTGKRGISSPYRKPHSLPLNLSKDVSGRLGEENHDDDNGLNTSIAAQSLRHLAALLGQTI